VSGIVHLVGAGPGDPGLLTVRAVELIAAADVILYDRLIPPEALSHARQDAEIVYVGKQGEGPQFPQDDTHRLLLEHARAGRRVVRLKGGDPFVFGRGGEEALVLHEAGVPFEVVPGVTAGVAAPAYAGHDLERDAGLVQDERLLSAAAEHERVAALQAHNPAAGAAIPAVIPGTTSNGMPASRSASASSPPRPNTNGSPPLRRTTRLPARACSSSRRCVSSCGNCGPSPSLPT